MVSEPTKYEFADLPRLSREAVDVHNLSAALFGAPLDASIFVDIKNAVMALTQVSIDLAVDSIAFVPMAKVNSPSCFFSFSMQPKAGLVFCEIDPKIARFLLYRTIGGTGAVESAAKPFTAVEEGILSFIFLRVIKALQARVKDGFAGQLKIQQFAEKLDSVATETGFLTINFSLRIAEQNSYCRLLLTREFLSSLREGPGVVGAETLAGYANLRKRCESLQVPLIVEIGRLHLSPQEIEALEVEDIVVLEQKELSIQDGALTGPVHCSIGLEATGKADGQLLLSKNGRYAFQVEAIS